MTVAATLATAPLIAFHFGELSTVSLFANLLALPAVAPAMWLGMLSSIGAQVPGFPASVPNAIAAPLLAYIATVASWCARPRWALLEVEMGVRGLARLLSGPGGSGDRNSRAAAPAPHRGTPPRTNPRQSWVQRFPAAPGP